MKKNNYTIGIDIGTTSTKAVLYDLDFQVIDSAYEGYDIIQLEEGMSEQDPAGIFQAVLSSIRMLMEKNKEKQDEIHYLSFSSAMHSVIFLDEQEELLSNCIIWADNRSGKIVNQLKETMDWRNLYQKTGTPVHSMTPLSKLLWFKETYPALFKETKRIIGIKEYVMHKLTSEYKVDYSIASATALFNIHELEWDKEILDLAGIDETFLSEPVDVTYKWDKIEPVYAREMHIDPETELIIGASDGCLSNLGVGAMNPGETAVTIGTSGAIRMVTDGIVLDPEGRTFCYYLSRNRWVIGGAVNNGGNVMAWLSAVLYPNGNLDLNNKYETRIDQMNHLAEEVNPGSDGLIFHPYLNGERAPLWDSEARGSFIGLSSYHTSGHMVRAAMEGVLFNLYEVWQLIQEVGGPSITIKVTGGFLNSPLWKQMIADIFDRPMQLPECFESSCLGAVMLGNVSEEKADASLQQENAAMEAGADGIEITNRVQPNPQVMKQYKRVIPIYELLTQELTKLNRLVLDRN